MSMTKRYMEDVDELASRRVTCRYLSRRTSTQCTGESVDPVGEILLCSRHLALALELVNARMSAVRPAGKATR